MRITDTPYDVAMGLSKQELARSLVDANAEIERIRPARPTGSNADEWAVWFFEYAGYGAQFLGVQIAEAMERSKVPDDVLNTIKKLVFAARTSGGVAGRDERLCQACDKAEAALARYTPPRS